MNVKMIVTDLDSTLLPKNKKVTEYTKQVIQNVRKKGILFAVATARPVRAVGNFLKRNEYDAGVYHNGAVIWDAVKRIGGVGIKNSDVVVAAMAQKFSDLKIAVESNDVLYCNFDSTYLWPDSSYIFTLDFNELHGKIADKIIIVTEDLDVINGCKETLPDELYIQPAESTIAMIMNKGATKMEGIKILAEIYNIDVSEIVAFGDDYNDIEMLTGCEVGVAMKNALQDVKKVADELTEYDNEHNGVANWIEKNILHEGLNKNV